MNSKFMKGSQNAADRDVEAGISISGCESGIRTFWDADIFRERMMNMGYYGYGYGYYFDPTYVLVLMGRCFVCGRRRESVPLTISFPECRAGRA